MAKVEKKAEETEMIEKGIVMEMLSELIDQYKEVGKTLLDSRKIIKERDKGVKYMFNSVLDVNQDLADKFKGIGETITKTAQQALDKVELDEDSPKWKKTLIGVPKDTGSKIVSLNIDAQEAVYKNWTKLLKNLELKEKEAEEVEVEAATEAKPKKAAPKKAAAKKAPASKAKKAAEK